MDPTEKEAGLHPDHTTTFRITNNGKFDVTVDFAMKSGSIRPPSEPSSNQGGAKQTKPPPGAKKGIVDIPPPICPFTLSPETVHLKARVLVLHETSVYLQSTHLMLSRVLMLIPACPQDLLSHKFNKYAFMFFRQMNLV